MCLLQARSRLVEVLETVEGSEEEDGSERDLKFYEEIDADKHVRNKVGQRDNRIHGITDMYEDRQNIKDQEHQRDRRMQRELELEDDRQDLRGQVRFLKEANKKVLIQNQKLMNEVEKTSFELQASRAKVVFFIYIYQLFSSLHPLIFFFATFKMRTQKHSTCIYQLPFHFQRFKIPTKLTRCYSLNFSFRC